MFSFGFADAAATPPGKPVKGQPVEGEEEEQLEEETAGAAVAAALTEISPWAIAVLTHVALVILAIFIVWSTLQNLEEEVPIIPIAKISKNPGAPLTMKSMSKISKASSARRTVTKTTKQQTNLTSKVKLNTSLIGVRGGTTGKASPFGSGVGTGGPFKAGFFGSGGNARKIAFIVDASGSLIDTLPFVIVELKRSISELSEAQQFTVIFYQGDQSIEVPRPGLKKADASNKQFVIEWIDPVSGNIIPGGKSNPLKAIKVALRYKPQLVFLLSDNITGRGKFELNQARLMDEIRKANVGGAKINTIQFLYPDPLARAGLTGTLELIANETGGIYKFLSASELGIE